MVNILIVDDEQINLDIIENLLNTKLDVNVFVALGVKEALKALSKINIDIIITDLMMPNIDGLEFIRILKDDSRYKHIPTIILTASCDKENELKSYKEGAFDYLSKPIIEDKLINKIKVLAFTILNTRSQTLLSNNTFLIEQASNINNDLAETKKENVLFKDDIVTIFTHELKTPLNAILSYSDYIYRNLAKPLTPKKIEKMINLASRINKNGLIQLNMVENILESSRTLANKKALCIEKLNLKHIILSTIDKYDTAYDKKIELDLNDVEHNINSKNFTIMFDNIYSNALKYSESEVKITLQAIENGYELFVEDDGDGIKVENRERVFHLFEQTDTDILQREKIGTGVGLYTAKLLAGKCGCDITIEDSSMGGAKFILKGTNV